jgi:cytochrome oxidase assembly protein ShyY1
MTAFVLLMLPTVMFLGLWQLDRAALKHGYEERYFARMAASPVPMPTEFEDADFLRVSITGSYDPQRYFLVDNQIHEGRPGYWVIGLLVDEQDNAWLVNRGWVAAPSLRAELPAVVVPPGRVSVIGVLWPDTGLVPLLAEDRWQQGWPKRVQRLDIERMAKVVGDVPAIEVRLEGGQVGVDVPASLGHDFKARTHEGYAAQWFGLAGVLTTGFIIFGFKRHD